MRKRVLAYVVIGSLLATAGARAGSLWEPLGDGPGDPDNQWVNSLVVWNGQLYALLNGTLGLDEIAAWDGTQWNPVGEGLYAAGSHVTVHNGILTMRGTQTEGGTSEILTWDGSTWTSVIPISFDPGGYSNALASFQGKLYAGDSHYSPSLDSYWGRLWSLGPSGWEHEEWFEAGYSFGGINIVTVLEDKLYVHVYSPSAQLHVYDGTSWSLHSTTYLVYATRLVLVNGDLYLGGLDWLGDACVLRWDGSAWTSVSDSLGYFSYGDIVGHNSNVMLGSWWNGAAGVSTWDGDSWTRLPGEMSGGNIRVLANYNGSLIAAGSFTEVDGIPMSRIARYVGPPTPVAIAGFTAHRQRGGVRLDWEISADETFEGFHIYRGSGDGADTRVNSQLIPVDTRSFVDTGAIPGATYSYVLVAVGAASGEVRSHRVSVEIPAGTAALEQNVPNPFNPSTRIRFSVPGHGDVRIDVFDGSGAWVRTLVDAPYGTGEWTVEWDGTGASGSRVASGVYYYRMRVGNQSLSKKMILLK